MHFEFEELTPIGYPGVLITGWAQIETERGNWYVDELYIGDYDSTTDWAVLSKSDPLTVAIKRTLAAGKWAQLINDELWG